jgi:hypothetical protein
MHTTKMVSVPAGSMWRPAQFAAIASKFPRTPAPARLGQAGSQSIFEHPLVSLAIDGAAAALGAVGTAHYKGTWRYVSWGVLIASSIRGLVDFIRLMNIPGPPTEETP